MLSLQLVRSDTSLGRLPQICGQFTTSLSYNQTSTMTPPFYFNGSVHITFEVREPTSVIYLNNWRLAVDESSLYVVMDPSSPAPGPDPVVVKTEYDEELEFYKVFPFLYTYSAHTMMRLHTYTSYM